MTLPIKMAIIGATTGVAAIACVLILDIHSFALLMTMWPTSILGFGYNGGEPLFGFILGTIEVTGNAVIYGIVGLLAGRSIQSMRQGVI